MTMPSTCLIHRKFVLVHASKAPSSVASGLNDTSSGGALKAGMMAEYRKDADRSVLVLLVEPNGKTNWWGVDQVRRHHGVAMSRAISAYFSISHCLSHGS